MNTKTMNGMPTPEVDVDDMQISIRQPQVQLTAIVGLTFNSDDSHRDLPERIETNIDVAGQILKRKFFGAILEHYDDQLIGQMRSRQNHERFACRGHSPMTFKLYI